MKKNKLNIIEKNILIGFIMLLCISNISAFVVSSTFWSGNSLKLPPGGTQNFTIILQNSGGSDLNLKATISSGSEALKLADSSNLYVVPAEGRSTVNLQATIPSYAKPGDVYKAKIDFLEVVSGAGGTVLGTSIGQSFDIVVVGGENNTSSGNSLVLYLLGAIIILLIIILVIVKLKKRKPNQKKK